MRPVRVTLDGEGSSAPIPLDVGLNPINVGVSVVVSGTVNWTVEQTRDNVFDTTITPQWEPVADADLVAETTSKQGSVIEPVTALRLTNAGGSTGSAVITVQQTGLGLN